MHALEGDGAGPTRYKHGRGIWWREFDGGVRRRVTEQSSCPRPPTRRRERQQALAGGTPVRAPGHRFQIRAYRCDEESEANPSRGFLMWAKLWERPATGAIGGGSGAPWQALFRRWEGKLGLGGGGGRRGDVVR